MKTENPGYLSKQVTSICNLFTMLAEARAEEQTSYHNAVVNRGLADDPECALSDAKLRARYFDGCRWGAMFARRLLMDLLEEQGVEMDSINGFLFEMPLLGPFPKISREEYAEFHESIEELKESFPEEFASSKKALRQASREEAEHEPEGEEPGPEESKEKED